MEKHENTGLQLDSTFVLAGKTIKQSGSLKQLSLSTVFHTIKTGEKTNLSEIISTLRTIINDAESQKYKRDNLPYFVPGLFKENYRNNKNLICTQVMIFDYDHLTQTQLTELRNTFTQDKQVLACFVSPRGEGLKVVYWLDKPITDPEKFSRVYKYYARQFNIDLGVKADKTSDCSRACFFSFDPNIYVNPDATPLSVDVEFESVDETTQPEPIEMKGTTPGNRTHTATRIIGHLIEKSVSEHMAKELLLGWNQLNNPPLPVDKIEYTVRDMYNRYKKTTGSLAIDFKERNNQYFRVQKSGKDFTERMITSFKIVPKELLVLDNSDCLKCDIVSSLGNVYKDVLIENTDWHSKQKFLKALGHQDCIFLGSDNELQALCQFTQVHIPLRKTGTKMIGLLEDVWIVEGRNITSAGELDELHIVPYEKGADAFYHRIKYKELSVTERQVLYGTFFDNVFGINEDNTVLPYLGWFMAAPVKDRIQKITGSFPLLFVHGGHGSGKTSTAEVFARLAGYTDPKPNSITLKTFPMLKLLSSTNGIPIWFDEFKVADMKEADVENALRFMRKAYAGELESKGRADQTVENYKITAPMAVMGEWNINQPAIMERIIIIRSRDLIKSNKEMQSAFQNVKRLEVEGFMPQYIKYCLGQDIETLFRDAKDFVNDHFSTTSVAPRIVNNLAVMISGLELMRGFMHCQNLQVPFIAYEELLNFQLKEITGTNSGSVKSSLDQMIEEMALMAEKGELHKGYDFRVMPIQGNESIVLPFRKCFNEFKVFAKKTNYEGDLLDEQSYYRMMDDTAYITQKNYTVKLKDKTVKCLVISVEKAQAKGLNIDGFLSPGYPELLSVTQ